jgi:hypothetical protein
MSPHTPGPWEVVRHEHADGELWLSVNQHADANGMKEWIAEIKYLCTDPERQKANARLIAAAPELLAACKALIDAIDATASPVLSASNLEPGRVSLARTAIAKAESAA